MQLRKVLSHYAGWLPHRLNSHVRNSFNSSRCYKNNSRDTWSNWSICNRCNSKLCFCNSSNSSSNNSSNSSYTNCNMRNNPVDVWLLRPQ